MSRFQVNYNWILQREFQVTLSYIVGIHIFTKNTTINDICFVEKGNFIEDTRGFVQKLYRKCQKIGKQGIYKQYDWLKL